MVSMALIGGLSLIAVIMIFIIKAIINENTELRLEIEQKNYAIERAAQNIKALTNHQEAITNIRSNHNDYIKRIGKVKEDDDEEIDNILRDIITANNSRVSNRKDN